MEAVIKATRVQGMGREGKNRKKNKKNLIPSQNEPRDMIPKEQNVIRDR